MRRKLTSIFFVFVFLNILIPQISAQQTDIQTVLAQRLATEKKTVLENGRREMKRGILLEEICDLSDPVANRVFREYGAMMVGKNNFFAEFKQSITGNQIKFLVNCVFQSDAEVSLYHSNIKTKTANVGGTFVELQEDAMNALLEAIDDAKAKNLRITPRGGSIAAKRTFQDTVTLWNSRFLPGLNYWAGKGKISRREAEMVKTWSIPKQVEQVLEWEKKGYFFSKDLSKSILYSVAAPGASQHIFMLALDVEQFSSPQVRKILADHGWFQTVLSDLPHFTYLGVAEDELPRLGLEQKSSGGQKFWIPRMN